jgi:hypothetical protein
LAEGHFGASAPGELVLKRAAHQRAPMMDPIKRNMLAMGTAATAMAAAPRVFAH